MPQVGLVLYSCCCTEAHFACSWETSDSILSASRACGSATLRSERAVIPGDASGGLGFVFLLLYGSPLRVFLGDERLDPLCEQGVRIGHARIGRSLSQVNVFF